MDVFVNLLAVTVRKMEIIIKQYMPEKVLESEKREDVDQIGKYCLQDQNKDDEESTDDEGTEIKQNIEKGNHYNLTFLAYCIFSWSRTCSWIEFLYYNES